MLKAEPVNGQGDDPLAPFRLELDRLARTGLLRRLPLAGGSGATVDYEGRSLVNLASNDYLGLSQHPHVIEAACWAARRHGAGSGASRLLSGNVPLYGDLEAALAEFKECEGVLVFGSGYLANVGVISALVGREDAVFLDRNCHASLVDGARLSAARLYRYPTTNLERLGSQLKASPRGRRLIVTESVFSMAGTLAELPRLVELAHAYNALLLIDEAHATGVLGPRGQGGLAHFNLKPDRRVILMGTLGKALGSAGAFVGASRTLIDFLTTRCRTLIYSTALPPASLAASLAALQLLQQGELVALLRRVTAALREGLLSAGVPLAPTHTPILPVVIGDSERALEAAQTLCEGGVLAFAVRPPTVPRGSARIRLASRADLTAAHIDQALGAFRLLASYVLSPA